MADKTPEKYSSSNKYLKFSGITAQLAGLIGLAIWGGSKLDSRMGNSKQYMTALFVIIAFTGFMLNLLRNLKSLE